MAVALIVAAGSGERLGAERAKAFVDLAGRPMIEWSLDAMRGVESIEDIVVALPPGEEAPAGVRSVLGGPSRSHSVRAALEAAGEGDPIVVHDAARPLVTARLIERTLAALDARDADGVVAAAPVGDTIKQADEDGAVRATLERSTLWAVQTPQAFRRAALVQALDQPDSVLAAASDDASLVERAGGTVHVVPGPRDNLKVTEPLDLEVAELLLRRRA